MRAFSEKTTTEIKKTTAEDIMTPFVVEANPEMSLKEIANICGITQNLTTHVARHTFATTVTLTQGVPIETVAEMMGHQDIRTTQIYAKVIERKVSDDMFILREKLGQDKIANV